MIFKRLRSIKNRGVTGGMWKGKERRFAMIREGLADNDYQIEEGKIGFRNKGGKSIRFEDTKRETKAKIRGVYGRQ